MRGLIRLRSISFLSKLIKYICTDNLIFLSDKYSSDGSELIDKTTLGNDVPIKANAIYFDGSASGEVEFTGNILYVVDVFINSSIDNTAFNELISSNDIESELFIKDYANNKIIVGYDNTDYFTGWLSKWGFQIEGIGEVFKVNNASGDETKEYNIIEEQEQYWVNQVAPYGIIKSSMPVSASLNVIGGI